MENANDPFDPQKEKEVIKQDKIALTTLLLGAAWLIGTILICSKYEQYMSDSFWAVFIFGPSTLAIVRGLYLVKKNHGIY